MEITFSYIKNRIGEHSKYDLLGFCIKILDEKKNTIFPIWHIFILMKWTLIYGGNKYPSKYLSEDRFKRIYTAIADFNQDHISFFLKEGKIDKAFQVLYNQQFYLQKTVYNSIFYTQLKLFSIISGKYDIERSFKDKTGISIFDFLFVEYIIYLYINANELEGESELYFDGHLEGYFLDVVASIAGKKNVEGFLNLLTLHALNVQGGITNFKHKINKEDLQTMEMSFFTMFPFILFQDKIKLIHPSIFNHTANYYIYDFMKANDENFTTEFGSRLEKYIGYGLTEMEYQYLTENDLKKQLPKNSKLVDFYIADENIFIESKAIELQAYPSVNPTDDLLYSALKSSIFKAYFEQLTNVSNQLSPNKENWGIIITYKELFWSAFSKLYPIGKMNYPDDVYNEQMPPENVFIIDIYTWDNIVQIVKEKKATLLEILQIAKQSNSTEETSKQLFGMHLDIFRPFKLKLSYLQNEHRLFELEPR